MAAIKRFRELLGDLGLTRREPSDDPESTGAGWKPSDSVQTLPGKEYGCGWSDEDIEAFAAEDGGDSAHDPSVWGENTDLHVITMLNSSVEVVPHLAGHALRQDLVELDQRIELDTVDAHQAEQDALDDIEREREARRERDGLAQEIARVKLACPQPEDMRRYVAKLAGLVVGDLIFISTSFQVFGLSDKQQLGIPLLTELHLAAFSSLLALLVLAHYAGEAIKAYPDSAHPIWMRLLGPAAWIAGAGAILFGVSAIRAAYLTSQDVEAHTELFVALQVGIFCAALALSIDHAHKFSRDWARVGHRVRRAARNSQRSISRHAKIVGAVNGLIDQREAQVALAVHHVRLAETDTPRQAQLYLRRVKHCLPEPVFDRLFPSVIPEPQIRADDEMQAKLLEGDLPPFERLNTKRVTEAREGLRTVGEPPLAGADGDEGGESR